MRRNIIVIAAILVAIGGAVYAAGSIDFAGMIVRAHGGAAAGDGSSH
jgi:hypothetical protein